MQAFLRAETTRVLHEQPFSLRAKGCTSHQFYELCKHFISHQIVREHLLTITVPSRESDSRGVFKMFFIANKGFYEDICEDDDGKWLIEPLVHASLTQKPLNLDNTFRSSSWQFQLNSRFQRIIDTCVSERGTIYARLTTTLVEPTEGETANKNTTDSSYNMGFKVSLTWYDIDYEEARNKNGRLNEPEQSQPYLLHVVGNTSPTICDAETDAVAKFASECILKCK